MKERVAHTENGMRIRHDDKDCHVLESAGSLLAVPTSRERRKTLARGARHQSSSAATDVQGRETALFSVMFRISSSACSKLTQQQAGKP
ncbi:MAG: hypothetical protein QHC90_17350 [Shinella sp.]|nr:hypothetical protein [Shinella sp.]